MAIFMSLFKGDSGDIVPVRPQIADPAAIIDANWVCKTALLDASGNVLVPARVENTKSPDNMTWLISLSSSDTSSVPIVGKFSRVFWVVQISNNALDPSYSRESHLEVVITRSGID